MHQLLLVNRNHQHQKKMVKKIRTDVSLLSVGTGASVTPEKRIARKKKDMKSLAMLPLRKDIIQNQDINTLGT